MFFREAKSKNSKSPILQLVENIRTEKGSRQRLVVSLGTHQLVVPGVEFACHRVMPSE